ncbi:hypothetical protein ACHAPT_008938 [Fusarium lateritium]
MLFKAISLNLLMTLGSVAASSLTERASNSLEARAACGKNTISVLGKCYCKSIAFTKDSNGDCGCDPGYKVSGLLCIADCPSTARVNLKNECTCKSTYLTFKDGVCKCDKVSQKDDGAKCTDICPGPYNNFKGVSANPQCECDTNYVPATPPAVGCVRDCSNGATPTTNQLACECKAEHFVLTSNGKECQCDPDYIPGTGADDGKCVPKCFNGATPKTDGSHDCECTADNFILTSNNRECQCDPDYVPGEGADADKCVPKCFNGATTKTDGSHDCECTADNFILTNNNRECQCDPDYVPGEGADADKCVPKCSNGATIKTDGSHTCECTDTNAVLTNNDRECTCKAKYTTGTGPHDGVCVPVCSDGAVPEDDLSGCKCSDANAVLIAPDNQKCECKAKYETGTGAQDGVCVPTCSNGAVAKTDLSGCKCSDDNAELIAPDNQKCTCKATFATGTGANSNKCVPVCTGIATLKADGTVCECPAHATLKQGDRDCECDTNYISTTKPKKQPACVYNCGPAKLKDTFDGCVCDKPNTEFKDATVGCGCKSGFTGLSRFGCVSDCGTTEAKWNTAQAACVCNVKAYTYTLSNNVGHCACEGDLVYAEGDGVCHESCGTEADWNKKSRACICRRKGQRFDNGSCSCPGAPGEQKWDGQKCIPDCGPDAQYDGKQAKCVCLKRGEKWANKVCACDAGFTWKNQQKGCVRS